MEAAIPSRASISVDFVSAGQLPSLYLRSHLSFHGIALNYNQRGLPARGVSGPLRGRRGSTAGPQWRRSHENCISLSL